MLQLSLSILQETLGEGGCRCGGSAAPLEGKSETNFEASGSRLHSKGIKITTGEGDENGGGSGDIVLSTGVCGPTWEQRGKVIVERDLVVNGRLSGGETEETDYTINSILLKDVEDGTINQVRIKNNCGNISFQRKKTTVGENEIYSPTLFLGSQNIEMSGGSVLIGGGDLKLSSSSVSVSSDLKVGGKLSGREQVETYPRPYKDNIINVPDVGETENKIMITNDCGGIHFLKDNSGGIYTPMLKLASSYINLAAPDVSINGTHWRDVVSKLHTQKYQHNIRVVMSGSPFIHGMFSFFNSVSTQYTDVDDVRRALSVVFGSNTIPASGIYIDPIDVFNNIIGVHTNGLALRFFYYNTSKALNYVETSASSNLSDAIITV
jgi:hypothetical protein